MDNQDDFSQIIIFDQQEETTIKESESHNELKEIHQIKPLNKVINNKDNINNQNIEIQSKTENDITEIKKDSSQKNNSQNLNNKYAYENEKNELLAKKARRPKSCDIETEKNNNVIEKEEDKNNKKRKYDCDNIIKKIKCYFLKYLVLSVNLLIQNYQTNKEKDYTLKRLSYTYSKQLNKQINLQLLKKPLQDVLSLEINGKYKSNKDYNKKQIELLLKDKNDIIKEILKITFSEWLDLFRKKKAKEIKGNKIIFNGYEDLLEELKKKNKDEEYISKIEKKIFDYEKYFIKREKKD